MTSYANGSEYRLNHWQRRSLIVGVVAFAACIIGALFDPDHFFRAYLFTYLFYLGLALGSLALVMIHHLTGGAWGLFVRRIAEAEMKTLPMLAVLFVPIVFGLGRIYPWANPSTGAVEHHESFRQRYLEPTFFYWRAAGYFVAWLALAGLLSAWSRRQDESAEPGIYWRSYKLSGPGLVLLGITLHFATIDWIMSLQTDFTSTIFGPLVFSGQLLSAYALAVAIFCLLTSRPEFQPVLSSKVMNDLGSLLFTLLVLWAYMVWFQFMLIWIADLPRGAAWNLVRSQGGWAWFVWFLLVFQFVIPFFLLLFRAVKQDPRYLGSTAAIVLASQLAFTYYQVMPAFETRSLAERWMDLLMPIGLGGIWMASFLRLLASRPLVPVHDLNYEHAVHLREVEMEEIAREEALAHV